MRKRLGLGDSRCGAVQVCLERSEPSALHASGPVRIGAIDWIYRNGSGTARTSEPVWNCDQTLRVSASSKLFQGRKIDAYFRTT